MTCTECGKTGGPSVFSKAVGPERCKTCVRAAKRLERQRAYYADAAKPQPLTRAMKHRLRQYGLTEDSYQRMWLEQRGRCLICDRSPEKLVVDHDHTTGRVRGLLCGQCNTGLGMFRDDPEALRAAVWYLANHSRRIRIALNENPWKSGVSEKTVETAGIEPAL